MKLKFLITLLFSLLSFLLFAQRAVPAPPCTEVLDDGSVVLNWDKYNPFGSIFDSYTLYFSPVPQGPFSQIIVINNINTTTYTHPTASANLGPRYYYRTITTDDIESEHSETIATMFITLETTDYENVMLRWNPVHDSLQPNWNSFYHIYQEFPPGVWQIVDSTQDTTIDHHFWSCNKNLYKVNFRISLDHTVLNCSSLSLKTGEILVNTAQPDIPVLDSVSTNTDGNIIIGWNPSQAEDTWGYIIYRVTTINDSIDFVPDKLSTNYTHIGIDPCNGTFRYAISAIDTCGNESPGTFDFPQGNLLLQEINYDPCLMTNTLTWNDYLNFDPPLGGYRVYVSENDGPFQILATLPPGQPSFLQQDLASTTKYSYYIRAFSQDGIKTSTSCKKEVRTYNSPKPDFMYLRYASVENNQSVNLMFYSDTAAHVQGYRIMRSISHAGPFEEIGFVTPSGSDNLSFSDVTASVNNTSYYYQVTVIDSCQNETNIANTARTLFLTINAQSDMNNVLQWNPYESWDGGVEGYRIYRRINDNPVADLLIPLDNMTYTFTDDVSAMSASGNKISYFVEAYEGYGNPYGFLESSYSNEVLALQEAKVYMPNAFLPEGMNTTLKPVMVFAGTENYLFAIYNRWGQLLFLTNDPEEGWNGIYKGSYVSQDVYVYLIRFSNVLGDALEKSGTVAVIF